MIDPIDLGGVAAVLGGAAALITVIGGFVMQVLTFVRQGQLMASGIARDNKLAQVHDLVNSQSEKLNEAIRAVAFAEGEKTELARHL